MSARAQALLELDLKSRIFRHAYFSAILPDRAVSADGSVMRLPRDFKNPNRPVRDRFEQGFRKFLVKIMGPEWEVSKPKNDQTYPDYTLSHQQVNDLDIAVDAKTALMTENEKFQFYLGGTRYRKNPRKKDRSVQLTSFSDYDQHWIVGMAYQSQSRAEADRLIELPDGEKIAPSITNLQLVVQRTHRVIDPRAYKGPDRNRPVLRSFPGDLEQFENGRGVFGRLGLEACQRYYTHLEAFLRWGQEQYPEAFQQQQGFHPQPAHWVQFEQYLLEQDKLYKKPEYHKYIDPETGKLDIGAEKLATELEEVFANVSKQPEDSPKILRAVQRIKKLEGWSENGLPPSWFDAAIEKVKKAQKEGQVPMQAARHLFFAAENIPLPALKEAYYHLHNDKRSVGEIGVHLRRQSVEEQGQEKNEPHTTLRIFLQSPPQDSEARNILFEHAASNPYIGSKLLTTKKDCQMLQKCSSFRVHQQIALKAPNQEGGESLEKLLQINPQAAIEMLEDSSQGKKICKTKKKIKELSVEGIRVALEQATIRPDIDITAEAMRGRLVGVLYKHEYFELAKEVSRLPIVHHLNQDVVRVLQFGQGKLSLDKKELNEASQRLAQELPTQLFMRLVSRTRALSDSLADHLLQTQRQVSDTLLAAGQAQEISVPGKPMPAAETLKAQEHQENNDHGGSSYTRQTILEDLVLLYPRQALEYIDQNFSQRELRQEKFRPSLKLIQKYLHEAQSGQGPLIGCDVPDNLRLALPTKNKTSQPSYQPDKTPGRNP